VSGVLEAGAPDSTGEWAKALDATLAATAAAR
jgi:hypothetical protein